MQAGSVEYVVYHVSVPCSIEPEGFVEDSGILVGLGVSPAFYDAPQSEPGCFECRGFCFRDSRELPEAF